MVMNTKAQSLKVKMKMFKIWLTLLIMLVVFGGCYSFGAGLSSNAGSNTQISNTSYSIEMFNGNHLLSGNTDTVGLLIVSVFLMFACAGLLFAVIRQFGQ